MKIDVYKKSGEKSGEISLSPAFSQKIKAEAMTQYLNYVRASLQAPIANTKNRGQVSGGGKKPWRQKGTGNARAGSIRSPLWAGGGVTFGPTSARNFGKRINANLRRTAILSIISKFIADKKAKAVEDFSLDTPKTKEANKILNNLGVEGKIALIISKTDKNAQLALRNISGVKSMNAQWLDIIFLSSSNELIFSKESIKELEAVYAGTKSRVKTIKKDE
jgi:large subunit ribosomal protein L4